MTAQKRWIKSTIAAADECTHAMPWQRGARRAEMIARRKAKEAAKPQLARSA